MKSKIEGDGKRGKRGTMYTGKGKTQKESATKCNRQTDIYEIRIQKDVMGKIEAAEERGGRERGRRGEATWAEQRRGKAGGVEFTQWES